MSEVALGANARLTADALQWNLQLRARSRAGEHTDKWRIIGHLSRTSRAELLLSVVQRLLREHDADQDARDAAARLDYDETRRLFIERVDA